jgi:DNA-binding GntR family transcriptional regulator
LVREAEGDGEGEWETSSIRPAPSTQTINVYDRLREDLLSGRLEPGRKLQMRFLTEAYQVGQTPLREALNRLTAEGLVDIARTAGLLCHPDQPLRTGRTDEDPLLG